MRKTNLIVIATIIATFVFSMFAIKPTTSEASYNAMPIPTPSPRKIRKIPAPTPSPITKVKAKKPAVREGGVNDTTFRTRKPTRKSSKIPRKRSTQKRQHLPCKGGDCK